MEYFIRFANLHWLYFLTPILIGFIIYKAFFYKPLIVKYSLVGFLSNKGVKASGYKSSILSILQLIILSLLILLCLRPQIVDKNSKVSVEGIDIILDLDVSGSMSCFDNVDNQKPRIDIAKEEALKFIDKRESDQVGVVIFAAHVVTLCPLTLDKHILKSLVEDLELGFIEPNGTSIGTSLISACNRLKNSKSKNKIIILLTDGSPSPGDLPIQTGIDIAKKLGIKIYTIGIGSESGGYAKNHFGMLIKDAHLRINKELLQRIAKETGGKFFLAKNDKEMSKIYTTIDQLEKTEYEADIYANYFDLFFPVTMVILVCLFLYFLLSTFIWFRI